MRAHNRGQLPGAESTPQDSRLIQVGFAGSEWKLIDGNGIDYMADIPDAARVVARPAGNDFRGQRIAVAAPHGAVVNFVRPRVIHREQKALPESTLQAQAQAFIRAIAVVLSPGNLPKLRIGRLARQWVDDIGIGEGQQVSALAADIRDRSQHIVPERSERRQKRLDASPYIHDSFRPRLTPAIA